MPRGPWPFAVALEVPMSADAFIGGVSAGILLAGFLFNAVL
jgi:hypothetical protein